MIKPTVGRVVLFHPEKGSYLAVQTTAEGNQPIPALVCCVWSDSCINIAGFDANGAPFSRTSVLLVQGDAPVPDSAYAKWMPYQKAQAAKETAAA